MVTFSGDKDLEIRKSGQRQLQTPWGDPRGDGWQKFSCVQDEGGSLQKVPIL